MIIDISPEISQSLAVFPGDVTFQRKIHFDFAKKDHLSLSSMEATLHLGSHADAPSHYHAEGKSIDQMDLEIYFGPCQVLDVSTLGIGEIKFSRFIKLGLEIQSPRVLFKTQSIMDVNQWQFEFSYLEPELIEYCATKGVKLIGIDTPSMDHSKSKSLQAHQTFFRYQISILEGLVLDAVQPGLYFLSALPLKLMGAEASPVRAILVK